MNAPTVTVYVLTESEIAKAFAFWDLRYRTSPEKYMSEIERIKSHTPLSYGEVSAKYLLSIIKELDEKELLNPPLIELKVQDNQ